MRYSSLPQPSCERLLDGLRHQMFNILTVIRGRASLAERQPDAASVHLWSIQTQVERATRLLRLAECWAGLQQTPLTPLDVNPIITRAVSQYRTVYPAPRITLKQEARGVIYGHPFELECAVSELILNALESDTATRVAVQTRVVDDTVHVAVEDDGDGIPADTLARAYEIFYSTRANHAGLGLPVAGRVATRHQGDLELVSLPRVLTRATLLFPAA